jgi:hypothetical protein
LLRIPPKQPVISMSSLRNEAIISERVVTYY